MKDSNAAKVTVHTPRSVLTLSVTIALRIEPANARFILKAGAQV